MSIIDRIRIIIDYKGVSERKFCQEVGIANGFLNKVSDIGSSKLLKILDTYSDINPVWLLKGEGEMLADTEDLRTDKYVENEFEDVRNYIKKDTPLLDLLLTANKSREIADKFENIQANINMIDSFLSHYNLEMNMIDVLKEYRERKIDLKRVTEEFKQKLNKEKELLDRIKPFEKAISELYEVVSDFNDKYDRLYCFDDSDE